MTNLTPERRAELCNATLGRASLTVLANDLTALLNAADERDRLAAAEQRVRALTRDPIDVANFDDDTWLHAVPVSDILRALDGADE